MTKNLLDIPLGVGRKIVESTSMFECPLLSTSQFLKKCEKHGLNINTKRLYNLERLGLFSPVLVVSKSENASFPLTFPSEDASACFDEGHAIDMTLSTDRKLHNCLAEKTCQAYYSTFQIIHLQHVLSLLTLQINMDELIVCSDDTSADWFNKSAKWCKHFEDRAKSLKSNSYRKSVPLLCQFISNRYYPQTQSDQRQFKHKGGMSSYSDDFISVLWQSYDWHEYAINWNAKTASDLFGLTEENLRHAYEGLSIEQRHCDPLENWWQLTQFISVDERKRLKGDALRAELMRSSAKMLHFLYKDLYNKELETPNEIGRMGTPWPTHEDRKDPLRYLEFVVNRFKLNPKPNAVLIVEGKSEEVAVKIIFEKYFGSHHSVYGIEIVNIGGVDNATGGKKAFYGAILRLVDYLHFHQTFVFIILDNENNVSRLKKSAENTKSIHRPNKALTVPKYIKVWENAFELDNYTCEEILDALNHQAGIDDLFSREDIYSILVDENPINKVSAIYKQKTNAGLNKPQLNEKLICTLIEECSPEEIQSRPIIKILNEFRKLAGRNHQPLSSKLWEANQSSGYLGEVEQS